MKKCLTTTLDLNKFRDKTFEDLKETFIDYGVILTLLRQSCLEYMSHNTDKLYDHTKDELAAQTEASKRIGETVGNVAFEAYNTGYVEGRNEGEKDVIKTIRTALDDGRITSPEDLSSMLDFLNGVSDEMYTKYTKGKTLNVQFYDDNKE